MCDQQLWESLQTANERQHRTLRCALSDRIVADRQAMMPLPPVLPDTASRFGTRIGRDHHVRVETCDYSVPPRAIGRRVEVRVELDEVVVTLAGEVIAWHRRSLAKHRTICDPVHAAEREACRAAITPSWSRPGDGSRTSKSSWGSPSASRNC
jgi:hypothetical protein